MGSLKTTVAPLTLFSALSVITATAHSSKTQPAGRLVGVLSDVVSA